MFDELPYLTRKFENIIIIPYDEYKYDYTKNRISGNSQITIFKIDQRFLILSLLVKLKRELIIHKIRLCELIFGRDKRNQLKTIIPSRLN